MKAITSEEFKKEIELDPAWASKLTEPVEITDFCNMEYTNITHLSPLLHFTGVEKGDCASFHKCDSLKIAEGSFKGFVGFSKSGVEKIGDLTCGKDESGNSSSFYLCNWLKTAQGNFEGFVNFSYSRVEKIENLTCGKNDEGIRFDVTNCKHLKKIPIGFNPKEIEGDPELLEKLRTNRLKVAAIKLLASERICIS